MESTSSSSPEIFPLVLGGLLLVCNIAFTTFTLWVVFRKRAENHEQAQDAARKEEDAANGTGEDGKGKDERFGGMGSKRSSWVFGRIASNRASSADTFAPKLNNIQEDDAAEEVMIKEEEAIMSWKELSCSYPSKRSGEPNITTLSNVSGHIRYQELVAIMGGSGGGKSTFMDILSGRKTLGNLSGEMSVLGTEMSPSSMDCKNILRNVAAYVPQNEQFFPNQTPEEAVEFAANLKMGRDERGDHVRKSRVREMLDLVGIPVKARTRSIGGTLAGGVVLRGLSGGERKRLALACAFAMKPKLIFLDEITSGLDSENAVVVIDLVKKLCVNMNVAAVVVIHQPSYEVFSHFDRLVMLCKGKCVFSDKLDCIPSFYDEIGRAFPEKYLLPADLLKAASEWKPDPQRVQPNELIKSCGKSALEDIKGRKKPTLGLQFRTVLVRHVMNHYIRNVTNLFARVLIYGLSAVLLGLVFWKIGESPDGQDLQLFQAEAAFGAGLFLTQTLFLLPFAQISTFFFDKNLFASESSIGLYPAWIYSLTQVVLETWVMSLCALLQSAIAIPMMSLWNMSISKSASFITMFSVFCVGGAVGNSIVLLTSILSFSQDFAFLLGSANVIVFLAMSGGFVPYPYMESWIVWLQWISPIKYSFQAFTWSLLSGTSTAELMDQLELNTPPNVSLNLVILVGIFCLCSACSVVALSRQKEVR